MALGRMYSAVIEDAAIVAATDLFQIEGATVIGVIHFISISQTSDVQDANAENLTIKIRQVTDALTTSATRNKLDQGSAAAAADVAVNQTSQLTTGAATIFAEAWNIALPFIWMPPPEQRIIVPTANTIVVTMPAPADSLTVNATMIWEEIGSA